MQLLLISVGRRIPAWVDEAFADYANRLRGSARLELVEVEQIHIHYPMAVLYHQQYNMIHHHIMKRWILA